MVARVAKTKELKTTQQTSERTRSFEKNLPMLALTFRMVTFSHDRQGDMNDGDVNDGIAVCELCYRCGVERKLTIHHRTLQMRKLRECGKSFFVGCELYR